MLIILGVAQDFLILLIINLVKVSKIIVITSYTIILQKDIKIHHLGVAQDMLKNKSVCGLQ